MGEHVGPWQKCRLSCTLGPPRNHIKLNHEPWHHLAFGKLLQVFSEKTCTFFRSYCFALITPSPRSPPEDAAESGRPLNARWSLEQLHHRDTETVHPGAFGMAMTCISVGENDLVITARPCKLVGRKGLKKQSKPNPGNNYITKRYK